MRIKKLISFNAMSLLLIFLISSCKAQNVQTTVQKPAGVDEKVALLLSKLSLEEKVGQMTQVTISVVANGENVYGADNPITLNDAKLKEAIVKYKVGSILNTGGRARTQKKWYEIQSAVQDMAKKETRLGIPILYGIDAIHGVNYTIGATLVPQQIGQAATWNVGMVEQAAAITAYETRASTIPWNFSPVLGVGRNPLWPRLYETLGEDVFLVKTLGEAMIKGYEGNDISDKTKVASCMKHYIGYSFPLSGKDRTPAWIPDRYMREYFLPSFKSAVDAGSHTLMINSGEVNGVPVHASHYLLTEVLRDELGFEGIAVTDWADIDYLYTRHKVASSKREAVKMAVNAGVDMSMVPYDYSFAELLLDLVRSGEVPISRINESVSRILRVKFKLGLFENAFYPMSDYPDFGSEKFRIASLEIAQESITLLKNSNDILPLSKNKKVLVTGQTSNSMQSLNGGWSYTWQGEETDEYAKDKLTVYEAVAEKVGASNVSFLGGKGFSAPIDIQAAVEAAKDVDYIVLCLGETSYTEKPGDFEDINLPANQVALAKALAKTGKPMILVLIEGRPRIINEIEEAMSGVLMAYLPANEGGIAIADVLFGDVNPSGKLPITYPRFVSSLVNYDHKYTEELVITEGSLGEATTTHYNPQYDFGFGLSYTTFEYSNLQLSAESMASDGNITISVDVTNTGKRTGKEVVQLYISDLVASITPAVKRLRGFEKIELNEGEKKSVSFKISANDLALVGIDNKWVVEAGEFEVKIGELAKKFSIK